MTRNVTKALSILMVDFSCALKLAMPITVLSAIREASIHNITVKGGKYLEEISEADTIVFDKTGTLTRATPTVEEVVSFNEMSEIELLRIAACMEEHFPHSMARAVVAAAKQKNIQHDEMHSKVEYIVAHGVATMIEGKLEGVICIEDPLKEEAPNVIRCLRDAGLSKIVMMTGDGMNDSPALSAADVGIAISDGAEIAREIADITIGSDELYQLVTLKQLSDCLMKRIHKNYRLIVGFNSLLILLGVGGVIQPTTSALLHNGSTLLIGMRNMKKLVYTNHEKG